MKKKAYEKPTFKVILLQHRTMLLAGSGDTVPPDAPWWDGEGGARSFNGFDDMDEIDGWNAKEDILEDG